MSETTRTTSSGPAEAEATVSAAGGEAKQPAGPETGKYTTFAIRKVSAAERIAIAMAYGGKQRGWAPDMTDFGKQWWITKATIGLNEVRRIVQATRDRIQRQEEEP